MKIPSSTSLFYACLAALLLVLGMTSRVSGQSATTGAIVGTVKDPQGSVLAGAQVRATNLQTNEERSIPTGARGGYTLPLLPVGEYRLEIGAPGFAQLVRTPITVRVTETVTVDAALQLEALGGSVTVTSEAAMLQRSSPTLGQVVDPETIVNLPLATRNYTQLLILSPGVSASVPNAGGFGLNSLELSAQGARGSDNYIEVNGIDATNVFTNALGSYVGAQGVAVPAADTLGEFKVQTALYSAATGRNAGANVTVVTRSGTNQFHGAAYEYFRNDALNANDFFSNRASLARPLLKQSQFGGVFGGPIQKNKSFFFGSYQGTRQRNGVTHLAQSIPFLPPLTNDRSRAELGRIFGGRRGFTALAPGGLGTAVANDGSNINPVALALLNLKFPNGQFVIPSPQTPTGETRLRAPARFSENQFNANLDRQLSAGARLSGKYFFSRQASIVPFNDDGRTPLSVLGFGRLIPGRNHNLSITHTQVLSPRLINVGRFGFTRLLASSVGEEPVKAADVGLTTAPGIETLPLIQVLGQFSVGATFNEEQGAKTDTYSFADSISYVRGPHSMQFGVEVKRLKSLVYDHVQQHAQLTFLDFPSFLLGQSAAQNGAPFSHVAVVVAFAGSFERNFRATDMSAFFQDDLRLGPRLTLNLGVRYEYFGPLTDAAGRNSNFDFRRALPEPPAGGTNSGYVIGKDTVGNLPADVIRATNNSLRETANRKNFGPRFGLAYQPFAGLKGLVLRSGYGIYYSRRSGIGLFQNVLALPFAQLTFSQLQPGSTATFENPLPPLLPPSAFPRYVPRTATSQQAFTVNDPVMRDPYMQHFSLGVQYELRPNYLLEAGYVGTKGARLIGLFAINQPLLASPGNPVHGITTNTVQNAILRVPIQGIAPGVSQFTSGFDSNYHALQVSLTKRASRGLQFTSAYTFSKALDNVVQNTGGALLSFGSVSGDNRDFSQAKGLSAFDRKHRLVTSLIWRLPQIKGASPLLRKLVNGWEVTGLMTLQSGLPLTITDSGAATIFALMTSRAQFAPGKTARDAGLSGSVTGRLGRYFDPSAFAPAPAIGNGTGFGDSGRGILRGPDQRNLDFAIVRRFSLDALIERSKLELRAEAFNLTNTPSFGNPDTNRAGPASFGVISRTTVNPRIWQMALRLTF